MLVSPLVIVHSKISFTSMDSNQNSFRHNNFIALRRSYIRILMCSLNICVLTRIRCLIDTIVCIVYAAISIRVCKYWLLVRTQKKLWIDAHMRIMFFCCFNSYSALLRCCFWRNINLGTVALCVWKHALIRWVWMYVY